MQIRKPRKRTATLLLSIMLLTACGQESTPTKSDEPVSIITSSVNPVVINSDITVYKSPTCGCCKAWVSYLQDEGYSVTAIDHDNVDDIKTKLGLTKPELKSCHTAVVDGYIIEGHVPANDIERLLTEKPANIKGLTAPGMPVNSPGMASIIPKDYAVLSFTESGETSVYSQY